MRLLVLDHLQAMFEPAQEAIGLGQIGGGFVRHQPAHPQRFDGVERAVRAQRRIAAAEDQLLGLREELDLADAAAAQLDVVARHRDRAVAAMGMDLALDRMDVLDRGEIEIAPPDERLDRLEEALRPRSRSPAQARALIIAARSQFWPMPS